MQPHAVAPQAPRADLSMRANSSESAAVRQALDLLAAGGAGASSTRLDAQSERQLAPFAAMFQLERLKSPLRLAHLALALYAPLGVLLLLLRALLVFLVALVLPALLTEAQLDRMGVHALFAALSGTVVRVQDAHLLEKSDIVVANHISEFDALALLRAIGPGYILGYDFYKKMLFFRLLRGKSGLVFVPYASRNQGGAEGRDQVREIIMDKLAKGDKPLMAFPEVSNQSAVVGTDEAAHECAHLEQGGLTNGQVGLLQYHKFLFSLGKTVQPLAIQASDGPFVRCMCCA